MPKNYAKPNQELTVPEHFYRQAGSSNWSVRLIAPQQIHHLLTKSELEFRKSTGQSDLRLAKIVGSKLIADKLSDWHQIACTLASDTKKLAPTILNVELIDRICAARLHSWMRSDDEDRSSEEGLSEQDLEEMNEFIKLSDTMMKSVVMRGVGSPHWNHVIQDTFDWCEVLGYAIDKKDPSLISLVRGFASVEKKAQQLIGQRNQGEDAPTPLPPIDKSSRLLSDVTEPFRKHKSRNGETKHIGTMLNAWKLFIEHCGDIHLDSVDPATVFSFMESRLHAASKPWSEKRTKGFGKRTLEEIFGYARTVGMMSGENPVAAMEAYPSLSADEEALRTNPRFPMTSKQINELLSSAWYDRKNVEVFRGKMRQDLGARYWVPLFGVFHGMRVREPLQLVVEDFSFDGDVYVLSVRKELEENSEKTAKLKRLRSLKNASTKRQVPVHPKLMELGFVEFVEARQQIDGKSALLFPSSMPDPDGKTPKLGRAYEQSFLRFVRDRLGFGHGYGNHSLRHQLEDRLRETQARNGKWPSGLGQQYTGRATTQTSARANLPTEGSESLYGKGYSPSSMLPYITSIDFSDLVLPKPYKKWLIG